MKTDICGAFPLLVTPWTEDARLDTEVLAREAEYVARCGVGGLVWPTAGEAIWTLSSDEYEAGLRTLAERSVEKGYSAFVVAVCPGKDSAEALSRAYVAQRIANETGARMAILARPPDSAADQPAIEAHYRALAGVANMPVIIQTFNDGKSPQPDIELLARLARDFPAVFGWVKEESPGLKVNSRMAELLAHPEIKKVLSGFGAKAWMFQGTKIGTDGIISQRPAYAPLFTRIYTLMKEGRGCDDPEMAGLYAKYLYMCNLGDTLAESDDAMRGPHLYVLQRLGIFRNRLTRDGNGVITDYPMTDAEKREVEERMRYCGLSPFDGCVTSKVSPHAVPHRSPRAKDGKIRVALIGCGVQTQNMIDGVLCEDLVAIVDPDPERFEWLGGIVASTCDVAAREKFDKARRFATYQDLFEKMGDDLDAVVIETPDHQHVLPAVMALRRGIHVFLDKPLGLTVAECDLLLAEARKAKGVVTQCGTFGHTFPSMKYCVDRIREGAIGDVTEVWAYDDRCNSIYSRPVSAPPPPGMDWDLWCGGSPLCDFYPASDDQDGMHPHGWHSWIGYGTGSIGNLGMHVMDVAFWALGLKDPSRVICHDARFSLEGAWSYRNAFEFQFPATEEHGALSLHWWDGLQDGIPYDREHVSTHGMPHRREWLNIPPAVLEAERENGFEKDPFHFNGTLFVGTRGKLWFTHHGGFRFMPRSAGWCMPRLDRPFDFNYRRVTTAHYREFYAAIREGREANDCFEYAVPLAKTVCLGNVAALAGKGAVLDWDGHHVLNDPATGRFVTKNYRKGWNPFVQ